MFHNTTAVSSSLVRGHARAAASRGPETSAAKRIAAFPADLRGAVARNLQAWTSTGSSRKRGLSPPFSLLEVGTVNRRKQILSWNVLASALVVVALLLVTGLLPGSAARLGAQNGRSSDDDNFLFLPNRRSIWVVNRKAGRFALYRFRDDEAGTVERSQVVTADRKSFPPGDTVYLLSERNHSEVLWVCNRRTGDVQMWIPRAGGRLQAEKPVATSIDLTERRGYR